jgi:hypothetical protein
MISVNRRIPLFLMAALLCAGVLAQSNPLQLKRRGDQIHLAAPQLHFIAGKALERLQNGSTVVYTISLTVIPDRAQKPLFLLREKFLVSFDLWEETYSVVQSQPGGKSGSRLTASMAEAWCLDHMIIPVSAVPDRQSFMVKLDCSVEEREGEENGENHSTLTLAGLIDVFSRKGREEPVRWEASAGPFRLEDLKGAP